MILFQVVHTEHVFSVYEFSVIEIGFSVMLKCFLLYLTLYFLFWIIVTAYVEVISMQLWSIYAAGNTVPIPFLRATDISPIALLSDNVLGGIQCDNSGTVAAEALQELFSGDGPSKKGRRMQNEVITPNPSPSPHQRHFCAYVFILYAADATSSRCLPKTDFKFYAAESGAGFSLPQNVRPAY